MEFFKFLGGLLFSLFGDEKKRRLKRDEELIKEITEILPVKSKYFYYLRNPNFRKPFRQEQIQPFEDLRNLLKQPSYFFITKSLETERKEILNALDEFKKLLDENIGSSDRYNNHDVDDIEQYNKIVWELYKVKDRINNKVFKFERKHGRQITSEEFERLSTDVEIEYENVVEKLDGLAVEICERYDKLMSLARLTL